MAKLVVLDRDGVINFDSDEYIKSPDEWRAIPGSLEAIAKLTHADYRVVVATNQSGLARGYFDERTLAQIHEKMLHQLSQIGGTIDAIFYCPHGPDDHCECRKPRPGLLKEIASRVNSELDGVPCVGDALRDIQAAQAVKAAPILVKTGKGLRTLEKGEGLAGVPVFDDLAAAVDFIMQGASGV